MFRGLKYDVFVWASDFEDFRGEGILARIFLKKISLYSNKKFLIQTSGNTYLVYKNNIQLLKKKKFKINIISKYISLFYGIILIWNNHLKKKKTIYLNYLPLWNFLIFFFLPRNTFLGPITGGAFYFNVNLFQRIIRKYFFPLFYIISLILIRIRFSNIIFSTTLLKKYIFFKKKFIYNFCLTSFNNYKNYSKNIDFFIYYKLNSTKNPEILNNIINYLSVSGFRVLVLGDEIKNKNVIYFRHLERNSVLAFLKKTKFTIISNENFYSLFSIDCVSCNVRIFYDKRIKPDKFYFNQSYYIPIEFDDLNKIKNRIASSINKPTIIAKKTTKKFGDEIQEIEFFIKKLSNFL
jgi:hypothetical protein